MSFTCPNQICYAKFVKQFIIQILLKYTFYVMNNDPTS